MVVDGVNIALCSEHVDSMTIKQIRELLKKKNSKQEELRKKLEIMDAERNKLLQELGEPVQPSIPIPQPEPTAAPAAKPAPQAQAPVPASKPVPAPKFSTTNIKTNEPGISKYPALDVDNTARNILEEAKRKGKIDGDVKVPVRLEQKEQVVTGRGGSAMRIPSMIKDTSGTTTIRVVNTGGDAALQRRAKAAAVELPTCPQCGGMGVVNNNPCRKCNGDGILRG